MITKNKKLVAEFNDCHLYKDESFKKLAVYFMTDADGEWVDSWYDTTGKVDIDEKEGKGLDSDIYNSFMHIASEIDDSYYDDKNKKYAEEDDEEDLFDTVDVSPESSVYANRRLFDYKPDPYLDINLDDYNKSDTLVVHCKDNSTDMLSQVYEGKNYDVIRDGHINPDDLDSLIESHDKLIFLGHGTSGGLINVQMPGYIIGHNEAKLLEGKKIFAIWCNADKYFTQYHIGKGNVITKNVPSEVSECRWVGYNVSAPWILENITYWSKCMADVVELSWNNPAKAVEIARENYQKSIKEDSTPDEIGVINYNTDAIQVQP